MRIVLENYDVLHLSLSLTPVSFFHGESCPRLDVSIQAVRGLPRLRAPATWHCSLHYRYIFLHVLVFSWCDHSMLASLL